MTTPRLFDAMKMDDSLASEIRTYEEENVPVEERIIMGARKDSVNEPIGNRFPKLYEEADIQGI